MKKQLLTLAVLALAAGTASAQATDTLAKIKDRGAVNLGVRDSSGLAFTLGAANTSASIPKWPSASSTTWARAWASR